MCSMAIEKSKHEDGSIKQSEHLDHQNSEHNGNTTAMVSRSKEGNYNQHSNPTASMIAQKQAIPRPNLQQVSLDPSSLKFISDIITERINYEFSVRDGRLIDKVKTLISSQTAPNSSVVTRYGHDENSVMMNTPQRGRNFASSSGPGGGALNLIGHASLGKPGNHASKIPVRVGLPKINSAIQLDGRGNNNNENVSSFQNARAPVVPRQPQGGTHPSRRPSVGADSSRLPHVAGRTPVGKSFSRDEGDAPGAPSPAVQHQHNHHHPQHHQNSHVPPSSVVEPVMDGIQYPQCRSKVYGPSYAVDAPDPLPGAKLALHHVYGYDGDVNRHGNSARGKNVLWADSRRVVYPAAAVVIVQEVAGDRRQGFFCGHSDDVTCLAVHPQRNVAASGQMGKDCCVLVWEIAKVKRGMSLNRTVMKLKPPPGIRGFCGVDFSGDGRFLVAVGLDDSRLLIVYDWKEGTIVATSKVGHSDVNQVRFNPYLFTPLSEPTTAQSSNSNTSQKADLHCKSCYTMVSFGGKNIKFWTLKEYYTQDESGLESISTFKGRPLNRRKGDQNSTVKFALEGNLGVLPNKNTTLPEITSMLIVNDNLDLSNDLSRGFIKSTPKARIFFGSANGSIYLWQQLEDDQMRASLDKVNNGGMAAAAATQIMCWQPRGRLVSVITELHDTPIIDMDYIRIQPAEEEGDGNGNGRGGDSPSGLVERIISSSSDGIVNVWLLNRHETANSLPLDHLGFLELNKEYARSVSWDATGCSAILGTAENSVLLLSYDEEILDVPAGSQEDAVRPKITIDVLTQSHNGKVKKLAIHPTIPSMVVSISSDKVVRLWDFKERVLLTCFALTESPTAVSFSPSGAEVVVGNEKGELFVYSSNALKELVASHPCAFTANDFSEAEWTVAFKRNMASKNGKQLLRIFRKFDFVCSSHYLILIIHIIHILQERTIIVTTRPARRNKRARSAKFWKSSLAPWATSWRWAARTTSSTCCRCLTITSTRPSAGVTAPTSAT